MPRAKSDKELTYKEICEAYELAKNEHVCTCNPGHFFYCFKHGIMGISEQEAEKVRRLMDAKTKK